MKQRTPEEQRQHNIKISPYTWVFGTLATLGCAADIMFLGLDGEGRSIPYGILYGVGSLVLATAAANSFVLGIDIRNELLNEGAPANQIDNVDLAPTIHVNGHDIIEG